MRVDNCSAAKRQHDYQAIVEKCTALIEAGVKPEWWALSEKTGIPSTTLQNVFRVAGLRHPSALAKDRLKTYDNLSDADSVTVTADGVYASVSVSGQIKSVDDLIKHCQVDTEKYIIQEPQFRKWDVTLKLRSKGEEDRVVVVPQIYVSFKTIARHPEAIQPVIEPIQMTIEAVKAKERSKKTVKRDLILADPHIGFRRRLHSDELTPFHDRRVLDLVLQMLQTGEFDGLRIIGDCMDFSEFTMRFQVEPEFYFTTQPALIEWAWWLSQFRAAAPNIEIDQWEGNHDKRMEAMIIANARAAYQLRAVDELDMPPGLSTERLLSLESIGVNYIKGYPDNIKWINQNVLLRHGDVVRSGSGDSAKAVVNKTVYTTIFGHIHRREYVSRRIKSRDGDIVHHAICPGCACHTDGRVPGSTSEQQWQQGLCVVEYTDDAENIIPIAIDNGTAIYSGAVIKARDLTAKVEAVIKSNLKKIRPS